MIRTISKVEQFVCDVCQGTRTELTFPSHGTFDPWADWISVIIHTRTGRQVERHICPNCRDRATLAQLGADAL